MSPLLAPVLAQLVTLGLSDRTEVRMIDVGSAGSGVQPTTFGRYQPDSRYYEASTTPGVALNFAWRRVNLRLAYSPTLLLTPLQDPDLVLFHNAQTALAWTRRYGRNQYTVSQTFDAGQFDYRRNLFAPLPGLPVPGLPGGVTQPPTGGNGGGTGTDGSAAPPGGGSADPGPGGTPQTPTGQLARPNTPDIVRFGASTTAFGYSRAISRALTFNAHAAYVFSGGLDEESRVVYPLMHSPYANLQLTQRLTRRDTLIETLASQYSYVNDDNWAWVSTATVGWTHAFTREISVGFDVGLAVSWYTLGRDYVALQIYPTAGTGAGSRAGVTFRNRVGGGILMLRLAAFLSPYINPTPPISVDPRIGVSSDVSWTRKKLTLSAQLSSGISIASDPSNALNSVGFAANAAYALGSGFSAYAGLSGGWQAFSGETVVPPTYTAFLGLTWTAVLPLN